MGQFFSFWSRCIRDAFWGNSAFANDWQWVFGNPAASALGGLLAAVFGTAAVTTGSTIFDAFLAALAAFSITWFVAFLIRLIGLPAKYFYREKERADRLENVDGKQEARNKLWALRDEGVALRNKGKKFVDPVKIAEWKNKHDIWRSAVLESAAVYSMDLRHSLDPVDKVAPGNIESVKWQQDGHQMRVSLISEILDRVYKFLNRDIS